MDTLNKNKPMTVCGGSCYFEKQVQVATDYQEKNAKTNINPTLISFFSQDISSFAFEKSFYLTNISLNHQTGSFHPLSFIGDIFRPPQYDQV